MKKINYNKFEEYYKINSKMIEDNILNEIEGDEEVDISSSYIASKDLLNNYVTLDYKHAFDIMNIIRKIEEYANDITIRRPLNFIMIANPGFGKSHFIKCLKDRLININVENVVLNFANFEKNDDFLSPIEVVRNIKISDKLPLLFIDEFDSNTRNYSRLLPLMWDGELFFGNHSLKLGRIVIILAGSNDKIQSINKNIQNGVKNKQSTSQSNKKLIDLLSRINGGTFKIPSLEKTSNGINKKVDKVCIAISLLQNRFGVKSNYISIGLLKFIADTQFIHGVRSISCLIDLIPKERLNNKETKLDYDIIPELKDPTTFKNSILSHHITHNKKITITGIIKNWNRLIKKKTFVKVNEEKKENVWVID